MDADDGGGPLDAGSSDIGASYTVDAVFDRFVSWCVLCGDLSVALPNEKQACPNVLSGDHCS